MSFPLEERKKHLDLATPCLDIGASSGGNRALLAMHLNTSCESLGMKTGFLCHACHNAKCSNVLHLYWGSSRENTQDRLSNLPDLQLRVKETVIDKYGPDYYKRLGSKGHKGWKTGKPASALPESIVNDRLRLLEESKINIYKYGWVTEVAVLWGVSHAQVRRFFNTYWNGPAPYNRSQLHTESSNED